MQIYSKYTKGAFIFSCLYKEQTFKGNCTTFIQCSMQVWKEMLANVKKSGSSRVQLLTTATTVAQKNPYPTLNLLSSLSVLALVCSFICLFFHHLSLLPPPPSSLFSLLSFLHRSLQPQTRLCWTRHCCASCGRTEKWLCPVWRMSSPSTPPNRRTRRSRRGPNGWRKKPRRKRWENISERSKIITGFFCFQYLTCFQFYINV